MEERNNSMEINNTDTESILLDKISANSTPRAIENKISLEDLFILIKTQNSVLKEIDEKFDSLENELKKQNNLQNVKLDQLEEKLEKSKNEIQRQNCNIDKVDKLETVSYTHLDVYKRQPFNTHYHSIIIIFYSP